MAKIAFRTPMEGFSKAIPLDPGERGVSMAKQPKQSRCFGSGVTPVKTRQCFFAALSAN
jgi:hypothetical protein